MAIDFPQGPEYAKTTEFHCVPSVVYALSTPEAQIMVQQVLNSGISVSNETVVDTQATSFRLNHYGGLSYTHFRTSRTLVSSIVAAMIVLS